MGFPQVFCKCVVSADQSTDESSGLTAVDEVVIELEGQVLYLSGNDRVADDPRILLKRSYAEDKRMACEGKHPG